MTIDMSGVNPAMFAPLTESADELHEEAMHAHFEEVATIDETNSLVVGAHAGEIYALSESERLRTVEIAAAATDDDTNVVSACVGGSTAEVVEFINAADRAGADGILLLPPDTTINHRTDAAVRFHEDVIDGIDLPLILFQHPYFMGGDYDSETLGEIAALDGIAAVKDAVWDVDRFQTDYEAVRANAPDVDFLVANDEHLLPSYVYGVEGTLLELASVIPHKIIDLFGAVQDEDLAEAQRLYHDLRPFIRTIYSDPRPDSTVRLKKVLELQGRIPNSVVRPPSQPIDDEEVEAIKDAMEASDIPFRSPAPKASD